MKLTVLFLSLVGTTYARITRPELTLGVNLGADTTGTLGGLEPKVQWQTEGIIQGCDVEGGIDLTVKETDAPPKTLLWGRLKRFVPGYGDLSARAELDADNPETIDFDIRFNGFGTAFQVEGNTDTKSKDLNLSQAQLVKDVDTFGGVLTLNPKYDFGSSKANARIGYAFDNTYLQVDAEKRQLTISQALNYRDKITPTVNADGDFSVAFTRILDDGKLTATWTPYDAIKFEWSDGVWETTIRAPLEGYSKVTEGVKVSLKRSVGLV